MSRDAFRILLIKPAVDERSSAALLTDLLKKADQQHTFVVVVANHCFKGLECAEMMKFELIIVYRDLPYFNSRTLLEILRMANVCTPVLLLVEEEKFKEGDARGFAGVIYSPFSSGEFLQALQPFMLEFDSIRDKCSTNNPENHGTIIKGSESDLTELVSNNEDNLIIRITDEEGNVEVFPLATKDQQEVHDNNLSRDKSIPSSQDYVDMLMSNVDTMDFSFLTEATSGSVKKRKILT